MRRTAPRAGRAMSLALAAVAISLWSAAPTHAATSLTLFPKNEHMAAIASKPPGHVGRMWSYWGELMVDAPTPPNPPKTKIRWGSYRAICVWVARNGLPPNKSDNRVACTVVMAARQTNGPTLVAEGLVKMPVTARNHGLFDRASQCSSARPAPPPNCRPRQLAITGATGVLRPMLGYVVTIGLVDGVTGLSIGP